VQREDLAFPSGDGSCAAWLWRPAAATGDVPCVVMGHGFSLTRHDGLERFARPLVEARRVVAWTYSFGAVSAVPLAAEAPGQVAALLLLCPFLDGLDRALRTPPALSAWITPRAIADALGRHTTIPVTAPPGGRAAMTLPGEADGFAASVPEGSPWRNRISPQVFLEVARHRPVRRAARLAMPVWAALGERDVSVTNTAIERLARDAPRAELVRLPYDHFEPLAERAAAHVAGLQVDFLRRHGVL
jgi:uncharacterized protein